MRDARGRDTIYEVYSKRGRIEWWWAWNDSRPGQIPQPRRWAGTADLSPPRWRWGFEKRPEGVAVAGFYVERRVRTSQGGAVTGAQYVAAVPYWFIVAVLLGLARWAHVRARGDRQSGRCACGYDLRATPERCPECGAVPDGGSRSVA